MAKFHGIIGFVRTEETASGVFSEVPSEYFYYGDVIRESRNYQTGEQVNDELTINNRFSIVADKFARQNLQFMRYIIWEGTRWKITGVEIARPRIILTVGGVYNGLQA